MTLTAEEPGCFRCPLSISSNFCKYLHGLNEGRIEHKNKKKILCDLRSDEFELEAGEAAADDVRRSLTVHWVAVAVSSTLSLSATEMFR